MLVLPVAAVRATLLRTTATTHPLKAVLVLVLQVMQPRATPMVVRKKEAPTKPSPMRRTRDFP
jgi:hypothetical protein